MNGKSVLIIGQARSGKTSFALDYLDAQKRKAIIIAPDITHPRFLELDYVSDTEPEKIREFLKEAKNHLLIHAQTENPKIFEMLGEMEDELIYLDDVATLLSSPELKQTFKRYLRRPGWMNQTLLMTTHRLQDDVPPVTSVIVREIYWVGPLFDEDEQMKLYRKSNVSMPYSSFKERLETAPKYVEMKGEKLEKNPKAIFPIKIA